MKIWIDGYEANIPQRLGSGQVAFELLKNLEILDRKNEYTVLIPSKRLDDLPLERLGWKYKILKPKKLWTRLALPLALFLAKQKPDIFFSPSHYLPRFSPARVKKIVTIFDLSYLHFTNMFNRSDLWKLTKWSKFSIANANHIVTISNFSKQDIIKQYLVPKEKITVSYPGYNSEIYKPIRDDEKIRQVASKYGIEGSYIIYIGTLQPRKNLIRLIEAIAKIDKLQLVIVGKSKGENQGGWMYDQILKKPAELGIKERVVFTGFVPSMDLVYLLNGATAFVLVSLWEGFGIPVVEAMACEVPVVVSNVSSLPEVVGNAGLFVDPKSVDQIEQAIRVILTDKKLKIRKSKQGLVQAKKFSWNKMAKKVLSIFDEVVVE